MTQSKDLDINVSKEGSYSCEVCVTFMDRVTGNECTMYCSPDQARRMINEMTSMVDEIESMEQKDESTAESEDI